MSEDQQRALGSGFPSVPYSMWRERVEQDLSGADFERRLVTRTLEGISIQPLYAPQAPGTVDPGREFAREAPFPSGPLGLGRSRNGAERRVSIDAAEPAAARRLAAEAVAGGAGGLTLRLDPLLARGAGADLEDGENGRGLVARTFEDVWTVLEGLPLNEVSLWLEAGSATAPIASALAARLRRGGEQEAWLSGGWGDDPLGQLAAGGLLSEGLGRRLALTGRLAEWSRRVTPGMRVVEVSTEPYAEAGADAVQELGIALATGVAYLRALERAGLPWDASCGQVAFTVTAGGDLFMDVAKLRALRRGWARVVQACGGAPESGAAFVHLRSTRRKRARRDPWVNMLRATGESAAAAIGGADAVTVLPFDDAWGQPGELGRRIARNTALILQEESHLEHVVDPARGCWYLESLTEQLLGAGWELLQEIEREGGMAEALVGGSLQRRISDAAAQRLRKIARRQAAVTGVSSYPNLDEAPLETAPEKRRELRRRAEAPADVLPDPVREEVAGLRDALASPAPGTGEIEALGRALEHSAPLAAVTEVLAERGEVVRAERLATWRDAEPFEELRDRAERWRDEHGREPEVFVAAVGQLARLKPRIDFTANLLAAGGLRARVPETCFADAGEAVEAFADSGVPLAALVAADDDYPDLVPALAPALRRQGARAVLLAGRPGDREQAFREAGVDEFAFLGCDALEVLHRLLGRLEVS